MTDREMRSVEVSSLEEIREREAKKLKRKLYSAGSTHECPVCGEPFDEGSSGYLWRTPQDSVDTRSWVRQCIGEPPDYMSEKLEGFEDDGAPFAFVHKDEHIDV